MAGTVQIVCPACHAVNRVPADRSAADGRCGRCHEALFDGRPVELNEATFQKHISGNDVPVIVDFWAPWCGPCRMMAPIFERAARELQPRYRLAKVNTESARQLAARLGIRGIPTMILFSRGKEVGRVSGAMELADLLAWARAQVTQ